MSRPTARIRAARSAHAAPQVSRKPSFGDRSERKSRSNFGASFSSSFGDASFGIDEPDMATGGVMPMERAIALQAHFMQTSGLGAAIQRQTEGEEDEKVDLKRESGLTPPQPSPWLSRSVSVGRREGADTGGVAEALPVSPLTKGGLRGVMPSLQRQPEEEDSELDVQAKSEEEEPLHRKINVAQLQRQQDEEEQMRLQRQPEEDEPIKRKINVAQLQRQQEEEEKAQLQRQPEEDEPLKRKINVAQLQRQQDEDELNRSTDESKEDELQSRLMVQPKLTIGQPGDKYEQEADRTAAQVMAMPEPGLSTQNSKFKTQNSSPSLQSKGSAPAVPENFERQLAQHKGSGQPLSDEARSFMEPRFGTDFSNVRVHETPDLANAIQAQAFTHGQDIYFNSGKYNPGSSGGKELLAHELTHTLQQSWLSNPPIVSMKGGGTTFSQWLHSEKSKDEAGNDFSIIKRHMYKKGYQMTLYTYSSDSKKWEKTDKENIDYNILANRVMWRISSKAEGFISRDTTKTVIATCQRLLGDSKKSSVENNVSDLELLKGSTKDEFTMSKDPEHIRKNSPDPSDILPFTTDGWNANIILKNLGQYDTLARTDSDSVRCVQAVALGSYIVDGPVAVKGYLSTISAQGILSSKRMTKRKEVALKVIKDVSTRLDSRTASYGDLSWLQEAIHDLFYEDTSGTPEEDVQEQISPDMMLSSNIKKMSIWCSAPKEVMVHANSLKPGEKLLISRYKIILNTVYDNLEEDGFETSDRMKVNVNGKVVWIKRIRTDIRPNPNDIDLHRDTQEGHQLFIFKEKGKSEKVRLYEPETTQDGKHLKVLSSSGSELEQFLKEDPQNGIYDYIEIQGKIENPTPSPYLLKK